MSINANTKQNIYKSLRNSGFEARTEACRNDSSKC
jgi:hypothetical protein